MLKGKIPSVWGFSYFNVRLKTIGQWSPSGSVHTAQPVCRLLAITYPKTP
jgi:hypothetical protein